MSKIATKTYTASSAKNKFAELIDDAQRAPVAILRHGRRVAFVVSPADLEAMEDYYLGTQATQSITRGASMSKAESSDFITTLVA